MNVATPLFMNPGLDSVPAQVTLSYLLVPSLPLACLTIFLTNGLLSLQHKAGREVSIAEEKKLSTMLKK